MGKHFEYRGDLAKTALPEMLFTIDRFQVPGVIEARRDGVTKRIFVRDGHVLHATSTDLADSLGSYLLSTGDLTQSQYDLTMKLRETSDRRYGSLLVEQGLLSPGAVYKAVVKQVESIVWSLFYWADGEVTFGIGKAAEAGMTQILLPMRQVILSGIKRAPNAKTLVGRLGRKDTVFECVFQTEALIDIGLSAQDYQVLELVDGERTLYEVCTQGPLTPAENAKLLYAFYVLRLIQQKGQPESAGAPRPAEEPAAEGPAKPATGKITIKLKTEGDRLG